MYILMRKEENDFAQQYLRADLFAGMYAVLKPDCRNVATTIVRPPSLPSPPPPMPSSSPSSSILLLHLLMWRWWWQRRLSLTFLLLSYSYSSSFLPLSSAFGSSPRPSSSAVDNFIRHGSALHVLRSFPLEQIPSADMGLHSSAPFLTEYAQKQQQKPLRMFEVGAPVEEEEEEDHRSRKEACASVEILRHSFGNTFSPATATYRPPSPDDSGGCGSPEGWSRIVLKWRGASAGRQFDRIAGVWFGGVELLRTSTAEPSPKRAITWDVRKDVSKYAALLSEPLPVVVELGNVVDSTFTGVFHINISLDFFPADPAAKQPPSYYAAADLVLPFSSPSPLPSGHWFLVSNDTYTPSRTFSRLPLNLRRAVIEIYVSFHGSDEFWYTNPPNDFLKSNHLQDNIPGNGAFREVQVFLDDDTLVGTIWPYPVIYTGGIVNLYWRPAVGIGAFDLPTYELDVSPFIGKLADGKNHTIGVRIQNGLDHWLVDGSLHLWLDNGASNSTTARTGGELLSYAAPIYESTVRSNFVGLNGSFYTNVARSLSYAGYVATTSAGNVSVSSSYRLSFENAMVFQEDTAVQKVNQKIVSESEFRTMTSSAVVVVRSRQEYPLDLNCITNITTSGKATTFRCSLKHALNGNRYWVQIFSNSTPGMSSSSSSSYLRNSQIADGEILVMNNIVQSGLAELHQDYRSGSSSNSSYGHGSSSSSCYTRIVNTRNSTVLTDSVRLSCAAA